MSLKHVIGVNKIGEMMKVLLKKLGVNTTGHGARRISITTIVNDPCVIPNESLAFARHNSVSAQRSYVMRNNESEYARFVSLGSINGNEREGKNDNE